MAQQAVLESNTELSTDGYFVLSWDGVGTSGELTPEFRLEESIKGDFDNPRLIYSGPDKSRVISGKPDGVYQYRLALVGGSPAAYTGVISVEVKHHSIKKALAFFALGLVVFGAILLTVLLGMRGCGGGQQ